MDCASTRRPSCWLHLERQPARHVAPDGGDAAPDACNAAVPHACSTRDSTPMRGSHDGDGTALHRSRLCTWLATSRIATSAAKPAATKSAAASSAVRTRRRVPPSLHSCPLPCSCPSSRQGVLEQPTRRRPRRQRLGSALLADSDAAPRSTLPLPGAPQRVTAATKRPRDAGPQPARGVVGGGVARLVGSSPPQLGESLVARLVGGSA